MASTVDSEAGLRLYIGNPHSEPHENKVHWMRYVPSPRTCMCVLEKGSWWSDDCKSATMPAAGSAGITQAESKSAACANQAMTNPAVAAKTKHGEALHEPGSQNDMLH